MSREKTYDRIAAFYDLLDLPFEHFRYRRVREEAFRGLSGRVLDAGVGTGRNIAYYPAGAEVVGIDLSRAMLARAHRRALAIGRSVDLRQADVMATGCAQGRFDAIVSTFLFCVLDDAHQLPALRELRRICRPGGEIRIVEYAISRNPARRLSMKLWAPWVRFAYGAAFDRDTEQYLDRAGLVLVETRFLVSDTLKLIIARPGGG